MVCSSKPVHAQVSVGVTISARIAPPPLVVYEQPPCPVDGYMWCPGYWAYTDDGYYWVPGIWVLPPRYGYLWTPPWWGYEAGVYGFHPGYWGPHVGFYGGVNYGYGYWGSGFVGGRWEGNHFRYNTAVVNVNRSVVHNVYIDKTVVINNNTVNQRRVSYNGGPGGINVRPGSRDQAVIHETHIQPTHEQTQYVQQARTNRAQFANVNHGQPSTVVMNRSERSPEKTQMHEQRKIQTTEPTPHATAIQNPQREPSADHTERLNTNKNNDHALKTNQPPTIPQHYIPLSRPTPAPQERQHEFSRQQVPNNPQTRHPVPHQERMPQQQHPVPQDHTVHQAPAQQQHPNGEQHHPH